MHGNKQGNWIRPLEASFCTKTFMRWAGSGKGKRNIERTRINQSMRLRSVTEMLLYTRSWDWVGAGAGGGLPSHRPSPKNIGHEWQSMYYGTERRDKYIVSNLVSVHVMKRAGRSPGKRRTCNSFNAQWHKFRIIIVKFSLNCRYNILDLLQ